MNWRSWLPSAGNVVIMVVVLLVLGALIVGIPNLFGPLPEGEIQMGLVVVFAIVALLILLNVTASVFSRLSLTTPQHALGLPEGSIRALIALFLIMIFVIMSIYLFRTIAGRAGGALQNLTAAQVAELGDRVFNIEQKNPDAFDVTLRVGVTTTTEQLALQLATILGTLVTAVSAFYFGSATATSTQRITATVAPSVDSITPTQATASPISIELNGSGFVTGARVKLAQTGTNVAEIEATNVTIVDASKIKSTFDLTGRPSGQWDVSVINPDGSQVRKYRAFQIT